MTDNLNARWFGHSAIAMMEIVAVTPPELEELEILRQTSIVVPGDQHNLAKTRQPLDERCDFAPAGAIMNQISEEHEVVRTVMSDQFL